MNTQASFSTLLAANKYLIYLRKKSFKMTCLLQWIWLPEQEWKWVITLKVFTHQLFLKALCTPQNYITILTNLLLKFLTSKLLQNLKLT